MNLKERFQCWWALKDLEATMLYVDLLLFLNRKLTELARASYENYSAKLDKKLNNKYVKEF
jgi:hypothetical protein